jgi:hypothetical protein
MTLQRSDYDNPWKEALSFYFQPFMAFFFPQIESHIDWDKGYEFLDKEFQQIVREAEQGKIYADKLVKVWQKNGSEIWLLIHVEIQSQVQAEFSERMYVYNYRIFDRYRRPVLSLAVLADEEKQVAYITSVERIARQEGVIQNRKEVIMEVVEVRFSELPSALVEKINQIEDPDLLKTLLREAITIDSLVAFPSLT